MRRACRPSPAWLRWAVPVCAVVLLAPRPVTGQCDGPAFGTSPYPPALAGGSVAHDLVVGDYYGPGGILDGKLDVVVTADPDRARLFTGDGSGNLTYLLDVTVGMAPRELITADFDNDGFLDLALIPTGEVGVVRFFAGDGGGTFLPPVDLNVANPSRLATADFDRDGILDLVVIRETDGAISVFQGDGAFGFTAFTSQPTIPGAPAPAPVAAVTGDFDRNGTPDLAVAMNDVAMGHVMVYLGDGMGALGGASLPSPPTDPFSSILVGAGPLDIVAGDATANGTIDLVTADHDSASATVLEGQGDGSFTLAQTVMTGLTAPRRVALQDFDRNGIIDLAVMNETGAPPTLVVFHGTGTAPVFDEGAPASVNLVQPVDLASADLDVDGRVDLVLADWSSGAADGEAKWIPNAASPDCLRTSFYKAPRAHRSGDGPIWVAVADFDEDGHDDLAVADFWTGNIELLNGTGNGYSPTGPVAAGVSPRGVAAADFDVDGHADVVVAWDGTVEVLLGDGTGGFLGGGSQAAGATTSAVVAGDFNGDGAPDVAATAQGSNQVFVFLGDGLGGLAPAPGSPFSSGVGSLPRALAVGRLDGGLTLDLVVANSGTDSVGVFLGNGDGTFTEHGASPVAVGDGPWGVTLADFDTDGVLDLATADHDGVTTMTVRLGTGGGAFGAPTTRAVSGAPIAIGAFDVNEDNDPDVMVVTGDHTLVLFPGIPGPGNGGFAPETIHPVRTRPSSVAAVDADSDGRSDVAVPCRDADSVVVLLARPPGFEESPSLSSGTSPWGVVNADFDADGDLDIAVVNSGDQQIVVFENDGFGAFAAGPGFPVGGSSPQGLVIADFDRNGTLDLATAIPGAPGDVSVLSGNGDLTFAAGVLYSAGSTPVDLVVADFNLDSWPDVAVSNRLLAGQVTFLSNDGDGTFTTQPPVAVGNSPASITAADFDRDGRLDVAVANDNSDDLTVLYNDGVAWAFPTSENLSLDPLDTSPVSITSGDFDGDGDVDLAAAAFGSDMISVSENLGVGPAPFFNPTPIRVEGSENPLFLTAADVNLDGSLDLVVAAEGMKVLPGQLGASPAFNPSEDVVAGLKPRALTVGDFDRDGRPDTAVANETSGDLTILLSTACQGRRLVMGLSPSACSLSGPPYPVSATVRVEDDGGNPAVCEGGSVTGAVATGPGTFLGPNPVAIAGGVATFNSHTIDLAGSHYRLQFDLGGLPPVLSRSFSLGGAVAITGPPSVCPSSSEVYTADPGFDSYTWKLDGTPFEWQQMATLSEPPLTPGTSYTLSVEARVDGCLQTAATSVYVGNLASVSLTPTGSTVVCVDCLGGTVMSTPTGGGAPLAYQWGYRTAPGIPAVPLPIPGQTGSQYVINGLDFPDVGTYYLVVTVTPTCGGAVVSDELMVTVEPMVPSGEVRSLGATSRGPSGVGENILQWVNTNGTAEENLVRWNESTMDTSDCIPPTSPLSPADGELAIPNPGASKQAFTHTPVTLNTAYCYSVFVKVSGSYSAGRTVKARAFDSSTGPVAWAYASGATAVVPPTVSKEGILLLSNDQSVFSLKRGILGGTWVPTHTPKELMGVAHSRSPAVPFAAPVAGADTLFFVGDDNGDVTAINTQTGVAGWGPVNLPSSMVTGAPGGFFTQYGGPANAIVVGNRITSGGPSQFYSLGLATGTPILPVFDGTDGLLNGLGEVMSTPTLDYSTGRIFITSWRHLGTEPSVWCLQLLGDGSISPTPVWTQTLGDMSASPVVANGRVYVANTIGEIYSLKVDDGTAGPVFPTGNGAVKGFLFPNRSTGELLYASDSRVQSISDDGNGNLSLNWTWDASGTLEPNIVLHWPQTSFLYVGSKDGTLWEVDFSLAPTLSAKSVVLGDGDGHIGAPSLDIGLAPPDVTPGKSLLLVGSEPGVLYAVEVPLP